MKCPDDFVTLSRLRLLFGLSFLIPNFGRPCTDTHCETTTCPHKEQLKTVKLQFWPSNHWLLPLFSPLYRRWILTVFPADRTSPEKLSGHMDTAYRYIATQDTITDQHGRLPTLLLLEISTETGHLDHDCWYALPPISIAETSTTPYWAPSCHVGLNSVNPDRRSCWSIHRRAVEFFWPLPFRANSGWPEYPWPVP